MKIWTILGAVVVVVGILISVLVSSIHKIHEGNVGIYFKHGALQEEITHPGMHMMAPFVTEVNIEKLELPFCIPPLNNIIFYR